MTDRVLLGQKGSDWGLWVSKPGVDVKSASGADLLFDSNSPGYLNVIKTGTITQTATWTRVDNWLLELSSDVVSSWENFGTTLNYVPFVYYGLIDISQGAYSFFPYGRVVTSNFTIGKPSVTHRTRPHLFELENNRLRLRTVASTIYSPNVEGAPSSITYTDTIAYMVVAINV